jgi:hypothetical protein
MTRVRNKAGGTRDALAIADQLDLLGTADIEVFMKHFFKEDAAGEGSVEHLGEGEFDLQDGKVVGVSGLAVAGGNGMRQEAQPLPKRACRRWGGLTGENPVVERLIVILG